MPVALLVGRNDRQERYIIERISGELIRVISDKTIEETIFNSIDYIEVVLYNHYVKQAAQLEYYRDTSNSILGEFVTQKVAVESKSTSYRNVVGILDQMILNAEAFGKRLDSILAQLKPNEAGDANHDEAAIRSPSVGKRRIPSKDAGGQGLG